MQAEICALRGAVAQRDIQSALFSRYSPPTLLTNQYFYLKTRNYRMIAGGLRSGAKYAFGLGGATALYVMTDEATGWVRERIFDGSKVPFRAAPTNVNPDRWGWRKGPVHYEDGIAAGSVLGMVVGLGCEYDMECIAASQPEAL